jgi:signal recognition particle subunit SRP54
MFQGIQRSLAEAFKKLRGRGRITEANVREGIQEIRRALLDADVNFTVVNEFVARVTEKSLGQAVLRTLDPSEQIIKIVYDELVQLMGPVDSTIRFAKDRPTVLMLCGLQGQGKTTTAGKLALTLRERGRKPLLVAADLQRPAAVDQLKVLGEQIGVAVYSEASTPVDVCRNAVAFAKKNLLDTIILDTAGRLHIAEMPMDELKQIDRVVRPDEVYLVCDAMTGQDAVQSAKAFNDALDINGVILTKMDGDARGGAALSIKSITKVPIKFIGVGEKLDRLEEFRPEGMAQRIIGQGDIMSVIEKVARVQTDVSEEERQKQAEKLAKGSFTLDDFRKQFEQMKKMGPMKDIMKLMPGLGSQMADVDIDESEIERMEGIIHSMTPAERTDPAIIDAGRRRRIAKGSGSEPQDVSGLLKNFDMAAGMMKQMAGMGMRDRMNFAKQMGKMDLFAAKGFRVKQRSHRLTKKEREEKRRKKKRR